MKNSVWIYRVGVVTLFLLCKPAFADEAVESTSVGAPTVITPLAESQQPTCLEQLTTEMALELQELRSLWANTSVFCRSEHPEAEVSEYAAFLERFREIVVRAQTLQGQHRVSTGQSTHTDPERADDELQFQRLENDQRAYRSNPARFCAERVPRLTQDMAQLRTEQELCARLQAEVQGTPSPVRDENATQTASLSGIPVAEAHEEVGGSGRIHFDEGPDYGYGTDSIYHGPTSGLQPLPSPLRDAGQDPGSPYVRNTEASAFFTTAFENNGPRRPALSEEQCLSTNSGRASDMFWNFRSRLDVTRLYCRDNAGLNWLQEWNQFRVRNAELARRWDTGPNGQSSTLYQTEHANSASLAFTRQATGMCNNTQFQEEFLRFVRMNSQQIENTIAGNICDLSRDYASN